MEASYTSTPQFDSDVFNVPQIWQGKKGKKSTIVKEFNLEARALLDSEVADKTSAFVKTQAKNGKPFYVYAALTQIHPPFLPHPDFKGKSKSGEYADIQMQVDAYVGQIVDAVQDAGVADNTIIILTGDNAAGEHSVGWGGEGGSNGPWRGGLSTGYEGGLRTVGMIRWPGKIPADRVSDEIFSSLDWYRTLAALVGEKDRVPTDRPLDSVDQSDFLLGKTETSKRERVITYVGDQVFAVKWRTMKVHFLTAQGTFAPIVQKTFPEVYDIRNDTDEKRELWSNEGFAHVWVMKPVSEILASHKRSIAKYRNIKPGEDFKGYR